ncbi:hypothetical protein QUF50_09465 [Thiotrichales bacterium HSG1]|nr:hypothetical protein [Thiotrichales bacterium HSG1]
MKDPKAIYYGKVELIPGIICDGYVLDNNTAVMSERGVADLLGMNQMALNRLKTKWPLKTLKPFIDNDLPMKTNLVKVIAENSPHKGINITVYDIKTIETLIFAYSMAFVHRKLRENQLHIGERSVILLKALVITALEASIKQACGLSPNIQQIAQQNYVELVKQFGFTCSFDNEIATKKDIVDFLDIPISTLNSFLKKTSRRHPTNKT